MTEVQRQSICHHIDQKLAANVSAVKHKLIWQNGNAGNLSAEEHTACGPADI